MKSKKPVLLMGGHTDEMFTPKYALKPLLPYIKDDWTIWECAYGNGALYNHLKELGYDVVGNGEDFLKTNIDCDIIVTNPPYSLKYEFLKRAYHIHKRFAFLMPITALEGIKRGALYNKYGIQLIIPNRRINFITPNGGKSRWFATAWFTYGLNLEFDLNFKELER